MDHRMDLQLDHRLDRRLDHRLDRRLDHRLDHQLDRCLDHRLDHRNFLFWMPLRCSTHQMDHRLDHRDCITPRTGSTQDGPPNGPPGLWLSGCPSEVSTPLDGPPTGPPGLGGSEVLFSLEWTTVWTTGTGSFWELALPWMDHRLDHRDWRALGTGSPLCGPPFGPPGLRRSSFS